MTLSVIFSRAPFPGIIFSRKPGTCAPKERLCCWLRRRSILLCLLRTCPIELPAQWNFPLGFTFPRFPPPIFNCTTGLEKIVPRKECSSKTITSKRLSLEKNVPRKHLPRKDGSSKRVFLENIYLEKIVPRKDCPSKRFTSKRFTSKRLSLEKVPSKRCPKRRLTFVLKTFSPSSVE